MRRPKVEVKLGDLVAFWNDREKQETGLVVEIAPRSGKVTLVTYETVYRLGIRKTEREKIVKLYSTGRRAVLVRKMIKVARARGSWQADKRTRERLNKVLEVVLQDEISTRGL